MSASRAGESASAANDAAGATAAAGASLGRALGCAASAEASGGGVVSAGGAGWERLRDSGLVARAIRVPRDEIAYFKFLFESYEGVGIVRTVRTIDREQAIIAILATPDFEAEAEAILAAVAASGSPPMVAEPLPEVCAEDWFLEAWTRPPPE